MADKPILFSAPMVRALLAGTKTQTRRLVRFPDWAEHYDFTGRLFEYQPDKGHERHGLEFVRKGQSLWHAETNPTGSSGLYLRIPIMIGDRLWVRENFSVGSDWSITEYIHFKADDVKVTWPVPAEKYMDCVYYGQKDRSGSPERRTIPSIHMPRWASRLTLEVTDVRVQRLQDISEADAFAEGMDPVVECCGNQNGYDGSCCGSPNYLTDPIEDFADLWDSLNAKRAPWESNPWVVAYTFEIHKRNIDSKELIEDD